MNPVFDNNMYNITFQEEVIKKNLTFVELSNCRVNQSNVEFFFLLPTISKIRTLSTNAKNANRNAISGLGTPL